jgi:hypothetical protein
MSRECLAFSAIVQSNTEPNCVEFHRMIPQDDNAPGELAPTTVSHEFMDELARDYSLLVATTRSQILVSLQSLARSSLLNVRRIIELHQFLHNAMILHIPPESIRSHGSNEIHLMLPDRGFHGTESAPMHGGESAERFPFSIPWYFHQLSLFVRIVRGESAERSGV